MESNPYIDKLTMESNPYIDKLTMELLLNKTNYQKYLSKTDPQKHAEHQEFLSKITDFRDGILEMTTELLDNPKKMYTNEVGDAFDQYVQTLIKYLEIEKANAVNSEDDVDVMFPETTIKKSSPSGRHDRKSRYTMDAFITKK
jgi:hypothetical protein